MKLHHFITPYTLEKVSRIRTVGRTLAPNTTSPPSIRQVTESRRVDTKKSEIRSSKKSSTSNVETMHDFAVSQLKDSSSKFNAYHKIKHYD